MSLTRIAMWAMPFMGGRVVGATAGAAAGGAGAVCAAAVSGGILTTLPAAGAPCAGAKLERPAASANNAKQRSAVRGDGILLGENLLGDMARFLSALAWSDFVQLKDSR